MAEPSNGAFPSGPVPDLPEDRPEWQEAYEAHLKRVAILWNVNEPMYDVAKDWTTPAG